MGQLVHKNPAILTVWEPTFSVEPAMKMRYCSFSSTVFSIVSATARSTQRQGKEQEEGYQVRNHKL